MIPDTRTAQSATGIRRFIPILSWLPSYDRSWLTVDITAGLTFRGPVAPEAMAGVLNTIVALHLSVVSAERLSVEQCFLKGEIQ